MVDLTSLITAVEQRDVVFILILIIGFLVEFFRGFKEFRFLWHPRYRNKVIFGVISFLVIIILWGIAWVSSITFIFFILLWVVVLFLMILSVNRIVWPFSFIFDKIRMQVKSGEDEIAKKMLRQYSWFCVDPLMQFEWYSLCASAEKINGTPRESYEILLRIDKKSLFEKEKDSLAIAKAGYLVQLGNYNGAMELISEIKIVDGDLFLQKASIIAVCQEVRGELSASSDTLISALSSIENSTSRSLPFIFNNLGRIRKFEGNITEAFLYYEKAANAAVVTGEKHLVHTSYQNLIISYALEENFEKAEKWINDYHRQIDTSNVNDLQKFTNLNLEYYRQKGDNEKILSTIETGRSVLYPKLTDRQKILYDICELRIRWNSEFLNPSFLIHIENQLDRYLALDFVDRYSSLKEINGVLLRLKRKNELGPFLSFHEIVSHNLHEMENEIEKYLLTLPEYCVNEKCSWYLELASIQKTDGDHYDYQKILQRLSNLKDTWLKNGNYLECLMVGLNICDEAMFQKNKDLVWQSTQQSIKELERFKGHAVEAECFIRIAFYANYVGQQKCAEDFFQKFIKTGISIDHFADWIQSYYTYLLFNLKP